MRRNQLHLAKKSMDKSFQIIVKSFIFQWLLDFWFLSSNNGLEKEISITDYLIFLKMQFHNKMSIQIYQQSKSMIQILSY